MIHVEKTDLAAGFAQLLGDLARLTGSSLLKPAMKITGKAFKP